MGAEFGHSILQLYQYNCCIRTGVEFLCYRYFQRSNRRVPHVHVVHQPGVPADPTTAIASSAEPAATNCQPAAASPAAAFTSAAAIAAATSSATVSSGCSAAIAPLATTGAPVTAAALSSTSDAAAVSGGHRVQHMRPVCALFWRQAGGLHRDAPAVRYDFGRHVCQRVRRRVVCWDDAHASPEQRRPHHRRQSARWGMRRLRHHRGFLQQPQHVRHVGPSAVVLASELGHVFGHRQSGYFASTGATATAAACAAANTIATANKPALNWYVRAFFDRHRPEMGRLSYFGASWLHAPRRWLRYYGGQRNVHGGHKVLSAVYYGANSDVK